MVFYCSMICSNGNAKIKLGATAAFDLSLYLVVFNLMIYIITFEFIVLY